jgi:hypothetical protein
MVRGIPQNIESRGDAAAIRSSLLERPYTLIVLNCAGKYAKSISFGMREIEGLGA